MKISVRGDLIFNQLFGGRNPIELNMDHGTLEDVLHRLVDRYGEKFEVVVFDGSTGKIKDTNRILLNGQSYRNIKKRLGSEVKDGDEIRLSPIVTGG